MYTFVQALSHGYLMINETTIKHVLMCASAAKYIVPETLSGNSIWYRIDMILRLIFESTRGDKSKGRQIDRMNKLTG